MSGLLRTVALAALIAGFASACTSGTTTESTPSTEAGVVDSSEPTTSGQETTSEASDEETSTEETQESTEESQEPAAAAGTRDDPLPIGSTITGDEYEVVVNSVTLNATDEVLKASPINKEPDEGLAFAIVNLTITYTGDDSGMAAMVSVAYVTSGGNVIRSSDTFAVAPDPKLGLDEIYTGASVTGNQVLAIPVDDPGLLRISVGFLADDVFVALQ